MKIDFAVKVAAFCRELGGSDLSHLAAQHGMEQVYQRAEELLQAGRADPELEAALDKIDAMVRKEGGQGLYPSTTRGPYPGVPPGTEADSGAQWWTCPRPWCVGQGRVRAGQQQPVCKAFGQRLIAGPLPQ